MNSLKRRVGMLTGMFNTGELRQRLIVTAAILIALHAAWDTLVYRPQIQQLETIEVSLERQRRAMSNHSTGKMEIDTHRISRNVEQVATIKQQIAELNRQIKQASSELIAPDQMPQVLQELLTKNTNLKVTKLSTMPAEVVNTNASSDSLFTSARPVYKHAMTLGFEGNYLSTLAYIHAVEKLGWRIFWDSVQIDSSDYPRSRVSISLYTLSLDEGWIGV